MPRVLLRKMVARRRLKGWSARRSWTRPKDGVVRGGKGMQLMFFRGEGELILRGAGKKGDVGPRGRFLRGVDGGVTVCTDGWRCGGNGGGSAGGDDSSAVAVNPTASLGCEKAGLEEIHLEVGLDGLDGLKPCRFLPAVACLLSAIQSWYASVCLSVWSLGLPLAGYDLWLLHPRVLWIV